jgi:acyl-CoA synthetase (AMP-forming)/AMP-acid ligase II
VTPEGRDPESLTTAIEAHAVEILAATPTQLQFILMADACSGKDLRSVKRIPHGAEPMSEALRKRLWNVFPNARLIQRFGMTELGALPVSEDPADSRALFLEAPNHTWKVENGELHIWAPGRMLGTLEEGPLDPDDPWFRTGDLAERTGNGSIRILGRREELINVGGEKVIPSVVEELLLEHPDILDAQAHAIPNPMTGEAVAARIVCKGKPELLDILSEIRVSARNRGLSLASVPTRIEFVDRVELTPSGKRKRVLQA